MTTVFIAGSIRIKRVHPHFVDRMSTIVSENMDVVVGDANGADTSIQQELSNRMAKNVTVYCTGDEPRNNIGKWKVRRVHSSAEPGTRAFFSAKDREMASIADFGLMLWDAASTGTLSNVIELLKGGKKCVVFINKDKSFINVKEVEDIHKLVAVMSEGAKAQAERKIGLKSKIFDLTNKQFGLPL